VPNERSDNFGGRRDMAFRPYIMHYKFENNCSPNSHVSENGYIKITGYVFATPLPRQQNLPLNYVMVPNIGCSFSPYSQRTGTVGSSPGGRVRGFPR